ncbi:Retrovirus-related Pol polyprotein from transposon 17.6 [Vitis vinifera]|uniref:Retrovirus-related Pol polyprotein from transposon 17.6 n=1 Tax=Vitis vinifera TaxID=29760 RepID=A0A438EC59_VITVI|nr:Retrovirus-related Pol polyprotein from transposon 17.6 [Vitis vinifera]
MCDASDFAIEVVLSQREDGKPYVIYYANKTLNEAQRNYTTIEKELLAVVFTLDKFRAYLVGPFIVVFIDHSALKYLLTKQDAKPRLIRWILLLQEFNLQIKDKKRVENVVADHLSRLAIEHNSHVIGEVRSEWKAQDRKHFFAKIHAYYWEEPFLFKPLCFSEDSYEGLAIGLGKLTRRNMMSLNPILIVHLFYVWGIDFMGPFPMSFGYSYILVGVDYVSKWVEAVPCKYNDHRVVIKFLKENIFSRFGVPKAIINDGSMAKCVISLWNWNTRLDGAIKKLNMDLSKAGLKRFLDLNELEELRNDAYLNSKIAKERLKRWHDQQVEIKVVRSFHNSPNAFKWSSGTTQRQQQPNFQSE